MAGESDDLDKLFESVADGESLDWDALERDAPDEESRAVLRQLRLIAEVSEVHRSQVDEVAAADAAVTAPIPWPHAGWPPSPRLPHVAGIAPGEGGVWGHLLLVRKIGEGSYGEVYHAHDTWLDHPVALKLLKPEAESRVQPSDLLHEARRLARIRHTNVVTVHGADRHNGRVGFWMDFIDGETLAARIAKGRMSPGEAISVGQEVCRALAAVHRANIIHRDVKAQNVMRAHDGGRIILMDFGAGQFADDPSLGSRAQGTPLYLAPELLRGDDATVRSDIYSTGVLLYHLVTGGFPVEAASPAALVEAHARGQRRRLRDERPDLPDSFIAIVERAIEADPVRRYGSAGEMEAKLSGEPSTAPVTAPLRPPPVSPAGDYFKRGLIVLGGLAGLIVALGFVASRGFEVVLRIDPAFSLGLSGIVSVGVQGLLPFVVYWMFGAAAIGAAAGVRLLLRPLIATKWNRVASAVNSWDPVTTATLVVLVGAVSLFVLNFVLFSDLFAALYALMEDPATPKDLSILGARRNIVVNHFYASVYSSMLLGLAVWRWFPHLEQRHAASSTVRLLKWCALAIALGFVVFAVMPRRILWERYPVVEFENRRGLVIGSAGGELLLYVPDEPGRPRRRIREDAPGLQKTAETRLLFDVQQP